MKKLKIIVTGFIGLYPTGGVTWDYIQYLLGLRALGHDVYYIEDTGQYSTYRPFHTDTDEPLDSVAYLKGVMTHFGLGHRWAYRDFLTNQCYGMSPVQVQEVCRTADVFLNVSAASISRSEYQKIPVKVLIDSDPMFTQLQSLMVSHTTAAMDSSYEYFEFSDYTMNFTFGENFGSVDCLMPDMGVRWIPTRQPIYLEGWRRENRRNCMYGFSTVMNWSTRSKLVYNDTEWGQKDVEFEKIMNVPQKCPAESFSVVLAVSSPFRVQLNKERIAKHGWNILPTSIIQTSDQYRQFIHSSYAEFSVAKETYVKGNTGWFSCRSACYLAAGKPVVTQETGWSKFIPQGHGLFSFTNNEEACEAVAEIRQDYDNHCTMAAEIAIEYFDSRKVLTNLLNNI